MRHLRRVVIGGLILAALLAGAGEVAVRTVALPRGLDAPPPVTSVLEDRHGAMIATVPNSIARACYPISLAQAGDWLPMATIAIEDHRFYEHHGVDFQSTLAAALRNLSNGRVISGASTITQQLVKNGAGRQSRNWKGKAEEALAALKLERTWSKQRILESYLNRLDYGNRRIGAEAASQAYFGKSARDLSLAEAIYLAGLPQSPARLNPWTNPARAATRYQRNVKRMAEMGLLPKEVDAKTLLAQMPVVHRYDPPGAAARFSDLIPPTGLDRVRTTLDLPLQRTAELMLSEHLAQLGGNGVRDAAIVVIDNRTGEVRALACAGEASHAAINSAIEPRSAGSTLKPFLYAFAIDSKLCTAATLLPDTAEAITEEYRDYDPQNYSKRYLGPVRLREALGNSLNVPAVVMLSQLGARDTFDQLRRWGLNFPGSFDAYGAGFILGNAPVRLLDLAGAYSALARGGESWRPKITPRDSIESLRVASLEAATIITDILTDNNARQISFGLASPLALPQRTAVKTGTSSGFHDGWCVGFNRDHTVAVWAGNLDGKPMGELLAVRSAAPLWAAMMEHLYADGDQPLPAPVETEKLKSVLVAKQTGLLPRTEDDTVREWFLAGTEPTENASTWYASGVLQLPRQYAAWCASPHNRLGAQVRSDKLEIILPRDGTTFILNNALPKNQQMLPLRSSWANCEWYLNGQKLTNPLVPLAPGTWSISARGGGQIATASFRVE